MARAILYLFRGETVWMLSVQGIPEEGDMTLGSGASSPNIVPTPFPRDLDVEHVLREVLVQNPSSEGRILNWH